MVGQQRAVLEAALQEDLVGGVLFDGVDDLVVLLWIAELHGRALVAEHRVECVEFAEGGEDVVDR